MRRSRRSRAHAAALRSRQRQTSRELPPCRTARSIAICWTRSPCGSSFPALNPAMIISLPPSVSSALPPTTTPLKCWRKRGPALLQAICNIWRLMFNPDGGAAAHLGVSLGWNDDLSKLREQLLSGGLPKIVADASKFLDDTEKKEQEELRCGQPQADHGCNVKARYLYQVARGLPKEMVFAQILAGFEMASKDPRVVGLNLVMPEDAYLSDSRFQSAHAYAGFSSQPLSQSSHHAARRRADGKACSPGRTVSHSRVH